MMRRAPRRSRRPSRRRVRGREEGRRIEEQEAQREGLDERAKELLWQYLQSTDTNEIIRLKAEQQEVLDQLEAAKAELARLRGEATGSRRPRPTPTRQPG